MTDLKNVRDTFLHFLADNLTGVTISPVRVDPNDPEAGLPKINAINVTFLDVNLDIGISSQMVSIDILNDSETAAVDWLTSLWVLMRARCFTPLLDYSNTSNPVAVGNNVYWDGKNVKFTKVDQDHYFHHSCLLPLKFFSN